MILEGLQYGFSELFWRTKPRGVGKDFFLHIFKNSYKTYKVKFFIEPFDRDDCKYLFKTFLKRHIFFLNSLS